MKVLSKPSPTSSLKQNANSDIKLLLYCCRTDINATIVIQIKHLLQQEIDWQNLMQLAGRHGVMPLLYQSLNQCPEAVPPAILEEMRKNFQSNALNNLFLTSELIKLMELLNSHNISVIPFKGAVLAALAYGNPALRRFGDLDILVHERDFCRARDLITQYGYQPVQQPWFLNAAQETAYLKTRNEDTLVREDGRVVVDLHRRLAAGDFFLLPLELDRLWEFNQLQSRLKPTFVAGKTILGLSAEDSLLFLCVHGSKHLWERLGWICDIAELLRAHPNCDWDWVVAQAHAVGCQRMLAVGLLLARDLLGAPIPEVLATSLEGDGRCPAGDHRQSQRLANQVGWWLASRGGHPTKGFSVARISFHLTEIERLPDKLQYCFRSLGHYGFAPLRRAITPSYKDRLFVLLPSNFFPLYYLIRPVRLAIELGAVTRQHLLKSWFTTVDSRDESSPT